MYMANPGTMCCSSQAFLSAAKANLHIQYICHRLRRFLLGCGSYMGIGIQGEACGEVTQHAGHRLDIHTILECDGCEGVAEVMESDLRDASPFEDTLQHIIHTVRGDRSAVVGRKHIGVIGLSLLLPQDFDCLGRDAHRPVGILGF